MGQAGAARLASAKSESAKPCGAGLTDFLRRFCEIVVDRNEGRRLYTAHRDGAAPGPTRRVGGELDRQKLPARFELAPLLLDKYTRFAHIAASSGR